MLAASVFHGNSAEKAWNYFHSTHFPGFGGMEWKTGPNGISPQIAPICADLRTMLYTRTQHEDTPPLLHPCSCITALVAQGLDRISKSKCQGQRISAFLCMPTVFSCAVLGGVVQGRGSFFPPATAGEKQSAQCNQTKRARFRNRRSRKRNIIES